MLETANAIPTAELRPPSETNGEIVQNDEDDMGMTYSELTSFGYHRKVLQQGAFSMTKVTPEQASTLRWCKAK